MLVLLFSRVVQISLSRFVRAVSEDCPLVRSLKPRCMMVASGFSLWMRSWILLWFTFFRLAPL